MPKEAYAGLTGVYTYEPADYVLCQLEIDGSMCQQEHGRGWIMKRTDGVEGYVGRHCARRHFDAEHDFAKQAARIDRVLRTDALIDRVRELKTSSGRRDRIVDSFKRQQDVKREISRIRGLFPSPVLRRLTDMMKRVGNSVRLEFEYRERVENAKGETIEVSKWRPDNIGAVRAPDGIDPNRIDAIGERLRAGLTAIDDAEPTLDSGDKQLRAWAESIEDADRCEGALDECERDLANFLQSENLKLLPWICRKEDDQIDTVVAVLSLISGKPVHTSEAHAPWHSWRTALVTSRRALRLRVP